MVKRRVFVSFCYEDQGKAKGFCLLPWNSNVDVDFSGRHLLHPVDSDNKDYIERCIREQIKNSSVTVVLVGRGTCQSKWVNREIELSLAKDKPNGILGIKLYPDVRIPDALHDCGAEIMDWNSHELAAAIERAALAAGRICETAGPCSR